MRFWRDTLKGRRAGKTEKRGRQHKGHVVTEVNRFKIGRIIYYKTFIIK